MTHIPVLLNEVLEALSPMPGEVIMDGTVGAGGYGEAIVRRIAPGGTYLGVDLDENALREAEPRILAVAGNDAKVSLACANFSEIPRVLKEQNIEGVDGIVLDLGFSSDQLERRGRGFSFNRDEPLLMTYSDDAKPVRDILQEISEEELSGIIRDFGEERYAKRVAAAVKEYERRKPIMTSKEFAEIIRSAVPGNYERGRIHPATRTFLALRIYANRELDHLEAFLAAFPGCMRPGARAVIVAFHSLEDRLVKVAFRNLIKEQHAIAITKKPITSTAEELRTNPRARSAKLRAIKLIM